MRFPRAGDENRKVFSTDAGELYLPASVTPILNENYTTLQ